MGHELSRRAFVKRVTLVGLALGVHPLLAGCRDAQSPEAGTGGQSDEAGPDCTDVTGLSELEATTRNGLQYVEASPKPDQACRLCMHWLSSEARGECGTCTLVPGPINPSGWCLSWSPVP